MKTIFSTKTYIKFITKCTVFFILTGVFLCIPVYGEITTESIVTSMQTNYINNTNNEIASPNVSAAAAILINADTGTVIYEKNADEKRAIASTTKIMTALLTLEAGDLDKQFTVDSYAIKVEGTSMGLVEGDIVTRRALCYGMLLPSGNDAANASAVSVSGSISKFAALMNKRATEIGMEGTNFVNPSGLDANGHYSTARDMALLTMTAVKNNIFKEICGLSSARVEFGNPPYLRWLGNNNKLLYMYKGCIGVKTGFTDNARRCLVSAAERDGVTLICVTLNAPDDWRDHSSLFDYGFSRVKSNIVDYDFDSLSVKVISGDKENVGVYPLAEPRLALTDEEMALAEVRIAMLPFLYSGFDKGTYAGNLNLLYNGKIIKTIPLLTSDGSYNADEKIGFFEGVVQFFKKLF